MVNYNRIKHKIKYLINGNKFCELKTLIVEKNVETKYLNDKYFDIVGFTHSLYEKKRISKELYDLIRIYYDNKIVELVKVIKLNDLSQLKTYMENHSIHPTDINHKYFNIQEFINDLFKDGSISSDLHNFIFGYFDNYENREKITKLIKNGNLEELKNYINNNHVEELKTLNNNYFNILEFTQSQNIPSKLKDYVYIHFTKERTKVIELIEKKNIENLLKYLKNNSIELKGLNDNYFNIIKYINSSSNAISKSMKLFIISHYTEERSEIIELIRKNNLEELKSYVEKNDIEFKRYNNENYPYFNIVWFSFYYYDCKIISCYVRDYIIINFDRHRRNVTEIIKKNQTKELRLYIICNNIVLDSVNGYKFDIVLYTCIYMYGISAEMKKFVKTFHDKKGSEILLAFIRENNFSELKYCLENSKISLKSLNGDDFSIVNYVLDLFTKGTISSEMKDLVICNYDLNTKEFMNIITKGDFSELKRFIESNNITFNNLNNECFDVKKYCIELYEKKEISQEILYYIYLHYDEKIKNVIKIIQEHNIIKLKNYISKNNIKIQNFSNEYFNFINYCVFYLKDIPYEIIDYIVSQWDDEIKTFINVIKTKKFFNVKHYLYKSTIELKTFNEKHFDIKEYIQYLYKNRQISNEMKNFIIYYFCENINSIIKLIRSGNLNNLNNYLHKLNIKLYQLNDKNFDLKEFCKANSNINSDMKYFITCHSFKERSNLIQLIENGNIENLKKYIQNNTVELKSLYDDNNFNIVEYCSGDGSYNTSSSHHHPISPEMKEFVIKYMKKEKYVVIDLLNKNKLNKLKNYVENNNIELKNLNDPFFNVIAYCKKNPLPLKNFVLSHYDHQRMTIIQLICENNLEKLKKYVEKNGVEFKNFNDEHFDLISYCFNPYSMKKLNPVIKDYVLCHYDAKRNRVIQLIKNNNCTVLKNYMTKENLEFRQLNDKHFNLIHYVYSLIDRKTISQTMKYFIIDNYDNQRSAIVNLVKSNNMAQLLFYIKSYNIKLREMEEKPFSIVDYCIWNRNISNEMKNYIFSHFDLNYVFQRIVKMKNLRELKKFTNANKIEYKEFNKKYNIIEYYNSASTEISTDIKDYITFHWTKTIEEVWFIIKCDNIILLNNYLHNKSNNLPYFKALDDEYFSIIKICNDSRYYVSLKMKNFIISHYTEERSKVIDSIKRNNKEQLIQYFEKEGFEFCQLNDEYFNLYDYCNNSINKVSQNMKEYITSHYTKQRGEIVDIIKSNDIESLVLYLREHDHFEFKELNDTHFNILEYIHSPHLNITLNIKEYLHYHYNFRRKNFVETMLAGNEEEVKNHLVYNNLKKEDLYDQHFNIVKYAIEHEVESKIIESIIQRFPIPSFNTISDSLLFFSLIRNQLEVSNILLKSKQININYLGDQLICKLYTHDPNLITENNIKFMLKNGLNITNLSNAFEKNRFAIFHYLIRNNKIKIFETILYHYVYNTDLILHYLFIYKQKRRLSEYDIVNILKSKNCLLYNNSLLEILNSGYNNQCISLLKKYYISITRYRVRTFNSYNNYNYNNFYSPFYASSSSSRPFNNSSYYASSSSSNSSRLYNNTSSSYRNYNSTNNNSHTIITISDNYNDSDYEYHRSNNSNNIRLVRSNYEHNHSFTCFRCCCCGIIIYILIKIIMFISIVAKFSSPKQGN